MHHVEQQACRAARHELHPQHHRGGPGEGHVCGAPGAASRAAASARGRAAGSGEDPHALPAGAERLSAHRPRQVDLPQLRARRSEYGGVCHLRFDDTNPSRKSRSTSTRSSMRCTGSASTGRRRAPVLRDRTTSTTCTSSPEDLISTATPTSTSRAPTRCAPVAAR